MNKLCFLIVLTLALLTACTVTPQSTVTTTEVATTTVPAISTTTVTISTTVFPIRIRVATDATWPPFEYVDTDTNEIVGFDIDLFNAIAKKAGLEVEWVNIEWDLLLAGATQGTYDAAISSITIREDLKDSMDFSDPYYVAGQIIVTRSYSTITGAGDLAGKRVGVQSGTTGDDEVRALDGVNVVGYDDIGMVLTALMNYQVDAVVCDTPVAAGYVGKYDTLKTVGEVFANEEYCVAIPKGSHELREKINKALAEVKSEGIIDQLVNKWMVISPLSTTQPTTAQPTITEPITKTPTT